MYKTTTYTNDRVKEEEIGVRDMFDDGDD